MKSEEDPDQMMENILTRARALEIDDGYLDVQVTNIEAERDVIIDNDGDTYLHCVKAFNPNDLTPAQYDEPHDRILVSSHLLRLASPVFTSILSSISNDDSYSDDKGHVYVPFTVAGIEPLLLKLHYKNPSCKFTKKLTGAGMMEEMLIFIATYKMHTVQLRVSQCVYHHLSHVWSCSPLAEFWRRKIEEWLPALEMEGTVLEAMQWVTVAAGMWQSYALKTVAKIITLCAREDGGKLVYGGRAIADIVPEKITSSILAKRTEVLTASHNVIKWWVQAILNSANDDPYITPRVQLANIDKVYTSFRPSMSVLDLLHLVNEMGNLPCTKNGQLVTMTAPFPKNPKRGDPCIICHRMARELREIMGTFSKEDWDPAPHFAERNPNFHYNPSFV